MQGRRLGRVRGVRVPPPLFRTKGPLFGSEKKVDTDIGAQEQNCAQNRLEARFYTPYFLNFARLRREYSLCMLNLLKTPDFGSRFCIF